LLAPGRTRNVARPQHQGPALLGQRLTGRRAGRAGAGR
jgi:hypothetical protein